MLDSNQPGSYAAYLLHFGLTRLRLGTIGIDIAGVKITYSVTSGYHYVRVSLAQGLSLNAPVTTSLR